MAYRLAGSRVLPRTQDVIEPQGLIHAPWRAPLDALARAGVSIGRTYPAPIVDHAFARRRALDGLAAIKG